MRPFAHALSGWTDVTIPSRLGEKPLAPTRQTPRPNWPYHSPQLDAALAPRWFFGAGRSWRQFPLPEGVPSRILDEVCRGGNLCPLCRGANVRKVLVPRYWDLRHLEIYGSEAHPIAGSGAPRQGRKGRPRTSFLREEVVLFVHFGPDGPGPSHTSIPSEPHSKILI